MMPDFQTVMLPLLELASDGTEHTMANAISTLAEDAYHLTGEERAELLPGGSQQRFNNRVYWAAAHLRAAGLIESPTRGRFRITKPGTSVLASPPPKITIGFLKQFPGYTEFKTGAAPVQVVGPGAAAVAVDQTPDEIIASAYAGMRDGLIAEILDRIMGNKPDFLERVVLDLLRAMKYGGVEDDSAIVVGGPGDEGIDGIIKQDKLGLDRIYVQAKRWSHPVSSPDIRNFIGSLQIKSADRGVFITTSTFTSDAKEAATKGGKQIVLIDGQKLANLMIDHGVGVQTRQVYVLRQLDSDFFDVG